MRILRELPIWPTILATGRRIHGPKAGRVQVTVSVATFVPKPHTPFQWRPQISWQKQNAAKFLQERLVGRGLQFSWHDPVLSQLEGPVPGTAV